MFCYLILKAPCGDFHLLLSRGNGSLFIVKQRPSDPFSLKGYRWKIEVSVDCDERLKRVEDYFEKFGPYGEIATIHDPLKRAYCWIRPTDSTIPQATIRPASYDEEETELPGPNHPLRNGSLKHTTRNIAHKFFNGTICFYDHLIYEGKSPYELTMSAYVRIAGHFLESSQAVFAYGGALVYQREKGKPPSITHLL